MRKNPGAVHQFYLTKITTPSKAARAARWRLRRTPRGGCRRRRRRRRRHLTPWRASPVVADSHARALVRFSAVNPPEWMLLSR